MITKLGNGLVLGFLFTASFAWAGQPASAVSTDEGQQITIGVYNYAKAGLGILLDAEHLADRILKNAGVSVAWLACSADKREPGDPGCADLTGPLKIAVRIEPDFMTRKSRQTSDVFGLGEAEFPCDVWVFYDQVQELAVDKRLSVSRILGSAITHELGHLLLGANSHSRSGLMRAVWSRQELLAANLGGLDFSDSERTRIQNSVLARHQAQGLAQAQQAPDATSTRGNNEIPFELQDGFLIVVEGRIAQFKGLRFVLDTGASYSVVDRKVAERLTLQRRPGRVFNFDRVVPTEWADFNEVQFGPIQVRNASLMVADLVNSPRFHVRADAIIGLDLLCASRELLIDYEARKVIFRANTNASDTSAPRCPSFLTMDVLVQGHSVQLMVDTGMEGILLYEDKLRKRFPNLRLEDGKSGIQFGYLHVRRAKLPGVRFGTSQSEPTVFLMKSPSQDLINDVDGYIGTRALNAQRIEFNFETNTLAW
jgi:predicted aspartyl protease